MVSADSASL